MKIFIKNMVCQGTRKFVIMEIKKLGLKLTSFDSGELEFSEELSPVQTTALERSLNKYGLEMNLQDDMSDTPVKLFNPVTLLIYDEEDSGIGIMQMTELQAV